MKRALVIEDDLATLEMITEVLEMCGYAVDPARNGPEGLDRAHRERPDVVLCDILLPRLGGAEVARRLRADPALGAVPIVLMSGLEEAWAATGAPHEAYVVKPFRIEELLEVLDRCTGPG